MTAERDIIECEKTLEVLILFLESLQEKVATCSGSLRYLEANYHCQLQVHISIRRPPPTSHPPKTQKSTPQIARSSQQSCFAANESWVASTCIGPVQIQFLDRSVFASEQIGILPMDIAPQRKHSEASFPVRYCQSSRSHEAVEPGPVILHLPEATTL